ncbi:MAG: Lrp/AsnC family transcriptional regulator [Candidatus Anstonellales archaeon]
MRRTNTEKEEILKKLLVLLEKNARMKNKDIAKELKISEKSVKRYISDLLRLGYISGFTVIKGNEKNVERISAFVHINVFRGISTSQICKRLLNEISCDSVSEVSGDYDIICHVFANNIDALNKKIDMIRNFKGVERTRTFIVLKEWQ